MTGISGFFPVAGRPLDDSFDLSFSRSALTMNWLNPFVFSGERRDECGKTQEKRRFGCS
jgi:hypothetical protein